MQRGPELCWITTSDRDYCRPRAGRTNRLVRLGRIGFDHVAGYLRNGLQSLESRPDLIAFTERLSAPFAAEFLSSNEPPVVIDVRTPREHEQKNSEEPEHSAESTYRAPAGIPNESALARLLCRGLSILNRRESFAKGRI